MEKRIKKLFDHKGRLLASVRDYEVEKCLKDNDVMHIMFQDDVMSLDPDSLRNKKIITTGPIPAKYGGTGYYLINYLWQPNIRYDD